MELYSEASFMQHFIDEISAMQKQGRQPPSFAFFFFSFDLSLTALCRVPLGDTPNGTGIYRTNDKRESRFPNIERQ